MATITSTSSSTTSTTTTTDKSSLGQSVLSALNAGSGVDTASLVTNLTAAQRAGLEAPIKTLQTANAAQISAAATLANDITTFSKSLDSLIAGGTLKTQPSSSDASVVSVTAVAGKRIGALSAQMTVDRLAQPQVTQSDSYAAGTKLAAGTLKITVGGTETDVGYSADATLTDVAAAINASSSGVTASVATDANGGQRLVLKGASGAAGAFTVDASEAGFAYGTGGSGGMTLSQGAQNASVRIDGVSYERASNSFSDVIDGVAMTITKTGTVSLGATRPTTAISDAINDFVSAYNAVKADIDTATAAATTGADAGALRGNATIRDMQRQLAKLTTTPLVASGGVTTLAELGVRTSRDGTLSVDSATLNAVVKKYPDAVEAMFDPQQSSSNSGVMILTGAGKVPSGVYSLTALTASGGVASGKVGGAAMSAFGNVLTAGDDSPAKGLAVGLTDGLSDATATISVDLGLGGALALVKQALTGNSGSITALQARLKTDTSTLADRLAAADKQVDAYKDRLTSQFARMETRVSALKATQSYLQQQVDLWTKSSS